MFPPCYDQQKPDKDLTEEVHGLFPRVAQKIEISVLGAQVVRGESHWTGGLGRESACVSDERHQSREKVGFRVGAAAALVVWALSRKPGDAQTAQKAGLRARGDRHRQAPLLWCLPSGSPEFQRGMSRVIARIARPRTRISRTTTRMQNAAHQVRRRAEIALSVQPVFFVSQPQASPNAFRARAKRDMTVPIGKAVISAI